MIVWASIYQAHDVHRKKKKNMFLPHVLKKQKQAAALRVSVTSREGCQRTNSQTYKQTEDTPDYLSSPNESRWGQFFVGIPRIIPMASPLSEETAAINGYVGINGFTLRNVHNVRTSRMILD